MLPYKNRLDIKTYFSEIRGSGKKIPISPYFSLYYRVNPGTETPQFNAIISKKVARRAVSRNRMRRLINTAIQMLLPEIKSNVQGLFFIHKDFSALSSEEVKIIIQKSLKAKELC
jgi:ribonuclease P protein component